MQPNFLDAPIRDQPRRNVRATSRAAYADGRARFKGRQADVLRWLGHWINSQHDPPTSAELAEFVYREHQAEIPHADWRLNDVILHCRRGLSDLQRSGAVERVLKGDRMCWVGERVCATWRPTIR